jgi:hypothetical protein
MTTKTTRYEHNPFLKDLEISVGSKNVRISTLGKDDHIVVNQATGEVTGTHVVARKKVDTNKFVKTFADYMAFTFDLSKAGNKALRVVMWAMQEQAISKDSVVLDKYTHSQFLASYSGKLELSYPTFARGLSELEKAKIIAKTLRVGTYFINPQCMFNGDRIAFTTLIERAPEGDSHLQQDLLEKEQQ